MLRLNPGEQYPNQAAPVVPHDALVFCRNGARNTYMLRIQVNPDHRFCGLFISSGARSKLERDWGPLLLIPRSNIILPKIEMY